MTYGGILFCKGNRSFLKPKQSIHQNHIDEDHQYSLLSHYGLHPKSKLFFDLKNLLALSLGLFSLEFFMDNLIELFLIFISLQKLVSYDMQVHIQQILS
jgi:hypothetical protein